MADEPTKQSRFLFPMTVAYGVLAVTLLSGSFQVWDYPFPRGVLMIAATYACFACAGWAVLWNSSEGGGPFSSMGRRAAQIWALVFSMLVGSPIGALSLCIWPTNVACTLTSGKASIDQLAQLHDSVARSALFVVLWPWW